MLGSAYRRSSAASAGLREFRERLQDSSFRLRSHFRTRRGQQFAPSPRPLESAIAVGYVFQFSGRSCDGLEDHAELHLRVSPSARCTPVNGLAGCYVSTIGKPHEYFDLTTSGCAVSLPVARPAADLSQPCAPPVGLSLATRSPGVGSQPCGAKYPRFCADSKGV